MCKNLMQKNWPSIPAVNYHLWQPCNMRCKFCFAKFEDENSYLARRKEATKLNSFEIIRQIAENGVQKITFVGGEPTLCPWLGDLANYAKSLNLTTMLVTNGSLLSEKWLDINAKNIDWITLSIDSLNENSNVSSDRAIGGKAPISAEKYFEIVQQIKILGIRLKLNTIVSAYNWQDDLNRFVINTDPERWKIFRALKIEGQNDHLFNEFKVSSSMFDSFINRHLGKNRRTQIVIEDNAAMIDSYLMIDPFGRFYDNARGHYFYSRPIWEIGWKEALREVNFNFEKFIARNGIYAWGS